MSRRRPPRDPKQWFAEGDRAQRVGAAGLFYNAAPLPDHASAVAEALGSLASGTEEAHKIDQFTLAADGAQDLLLTYIPSEDSENVMLRRLSAFLGDDYTLSGQTLSLLAGELDPRAGDKVQVQYDYLTGVPAAPASGDTLLNIPFQAAGWKYQTLTDAADLASWVSTGYDDTGWTVGTAPLGVGAYTDVDGHAKATTVPSGNTGQLGHVQDFVVRRWIAPGTAITVTVDETNYCGVYVNGTSVGGASTGGPLKFTVSVADQPASWLLAVYLTVGNGYTAGGVDIKVEGTEA